MLRFKHQNLIPKYDIFYAEKPTYKNWLSSYYVQTISTRLFWGFKRTAKYTKLIDITENDFSEKFDKTVIYEINRAVKESIIFNVNNSIDEFVSFYNIFAISKGFKTLKSKDISIYRNFLIITSAINTNNEVVVFHSYLIDNELKRVRLLHSASKIHSLNDKNQERNFIGRANKFLHFKDMQFFREQGISIYDFGGYAYDTSDISLLGINKFKDSFGGELVEESIYEAYPKAIIKNFYHKLKRKD